MRHIQTSVCECLPRASLASVVTAIVVFLLSLCLKTAGLFSDEILNLKQSAEPAFLAAHV